MPDNKETIDCTPTWGWAVNYLLVAYRDGNAEGKKLAEIELKKMAAFADKYVELIKTKEAKNG